MANKKEITPTSNELIAFKVTARIKLNNRTKKTKITKYSTYCDFNPMKFTGLFTPLLTLYAAILFLKFYPMKKALIAVTATIAKTQDPNQEAAVLVVSELPADHFP